MKIALVNNTASSRHFGCRKVVKALYDNLPIVHSVPYTDDWRKHHRALSNCDLVVVNGEGSIHHGRRMELLEIADYYPSVLLNSTYDSVPENPWLEKFQLVTARESRSARLMEQHGADPIIVPDLIFSHILQRGTGEGGHVRICSVDRGHGLKSLSPDCLQHILNAESVCSGGFHATCVAMMTGIPFTAFGTNTWKTESMLADANLCHAYADQQEDAERMAPVTCDPEWVHEARRKIAAMFKSLLARRNHG